MGTVRAALEVTAPATSANLGPGFDCLALSLALRNSLSVTVLPVGAYDSTEIAGEGADALGSGMANLTVEAMRRFAAAHGRTLPPLALHMHNRVPLGRGLGSSAAAIAAGLAAAAVLLDLPYDPASLLEMGLEMEGHPDNIAAALWGGLTIGVVHKGKPLIHRIAPPPGLRAVMLIPDQFSSTVESRATLPATVSRRDAIYNAGRTSLLAAAFAENRLELLRAAMDDRLHQPLRGEAFVYLRAAIDAATEAGALGAALSGAGTSVIALASSSFLQIAGAFERVACDYGIKARTCVLDIDLEGTTVALRP
jgi:homoserine kinase